MDVNESSCFLHKSSCEKKNGFIGCVIKQLFDEVERDIMNYQNLVSVLSAEAEG